MKYLALRKEQTVPLEEQPASEGDIRELKKALFPV
jgi:hypothetical protein